MTLPTSSPDEQTLVGPYRLLGQLGGGGMGIVWRAEHVRTGAVVALKTVRMPEPRMLASIRREIHALTRMRHSGVVRVVARGVAAGLPWYAMELLSGRTLSDMIEGTWSESQYGFAARTISRSRRLPTPVGLASADTAEANAGMWNTRSRADFTLEMSTGEFDDVEEPGLNRDPSVRPPAAGGEAPTLLRVVLRLCETLAVLHGAGVVHRDLKPDNVFVRGTGEPVLVDFGLAAHGAIGREILDAGGAVVGTLHYMAPEQLQGEYVDARADLYSLGCILYECLTGEPPFVGTPMQVIHQHLNEEPEPLTRRVEGISPALEALVQRLLCKDPRERAGYAADVAAELAELVGEPLAIAPGGAPRQLYRAGFAGRDSELEGLGGLLDHLAYGTGKLALVHGPVGAGKTRLLMEFARRAAAGRHAVVTGECVAVGLAGDDVRALAPPLNPFRELFLHIVDRAHRLHGSQGSGSQTGSQGGARPGAVGVDEAERLLGADLRVLAEFEPALLGLPLAEAAGEPTALPGEARRQRIVDAMTRVLVACARPGPLVILLDDVQWADELTLAVLAALPAALPRAPVLVVAAVRAGDVPRELQALAARPGVHNLALAPLPVAAARSIVADVLALAEPPAELLDGLGPADAGNPFFVTELLHLAHDEGLLVREGHAHWRLADGAVARLPRSMAEISARRLAALAPATRRVVDVASVLGRVLDLDLLTTPHAGGSTGNGGAGVSAATGAANVGANGSAATCVSAANGGAAVSMASGVSVPYSPDADDLSEEAVLDAVDDLILHRVVQRRWTGDLTFVHDGVLAAAYDALPADRRRALHARFAERLEDRGDAALPQLAHHWSRAGVPVKAFNVLVRHARRTLAAGAHQQAFALLQRVWELVAAGLVLSTGERAGVALLTAEAALGLGDIDAAQARLAEVLQLHGQRLPRTGLGWLGGLVTAMGRQFSGLARRAGQQGEPDPDEPARAHALSLLQQSYVARGDTLRLLATCFMAANTAEASREAANPAIAYSVIGAVCGAVGLESRAGWYFARASELSRRLGDPHAEVAAGVAECAHYLGAARWGLLAARGEALAATARAIGARHEWEGLVLITMGGQLRHLGCPGVRAALGEALASATARNNDLSAAWCRAVRSECDMWQGLLEEAEEEASTALPVILRGSGKASAAVCRGVLAAVHHARGDAAAAAAEARQVLADLRGETLLFMHEPGCRLISDVLLDLWERAQSAGDPEAATLRKQALAAVKLQRGLAGRTPFARATAARLTAKVLRIGGHPERARKRQTEALALASSFALERGLIELELALCHPPGDPGRAHHGRRACAHFEACDAPTGVRRVELGLRGEHP